MSSSSASSTETLSQPGSNPNTTDPPTSADVANANASVSLSSMVSSATNMASTAVNNAAVVATGVAYSAVNIASSAVAAAKEKATVVTSAAVEKATTTFHTAKETATTTYNTAKETATTTYNTAKETAEKTLTATREKASAVAASAKEQATALATTATDVATSAKEQATAVLTAAKEKATATVDDLVDRVKDLSTRTKQRAANFGRHASEEVRKAADDGYQWLLKNLTRPDSIATAVHPPAFDIAASSSSSSSSPAEGKEDHPGSNETSLLSAFAGHLSAESGLKSKVTGRVGIWFWRGKIGIFTPATADADPHLRDSLYAQQISTIAQKCLNTNKWTSLFENDVSLYIIPGVGDNSNSTNTDEVIAAHLTPQHLRSGLVLAGHGGHFMWRVKSAPSSAALEAAPASTPSSSSSSSVESSQQLQPVQQTQHHPQPEHAAPAVYVVVASATNLTTLLRPTIAWLRKNFYGDYDFSSSPAASSSPASPSSTATPSVSVSS